MIKQKGVCDVCTKEFELNNGCFAVLVEEEVGLGNKPHITIRIASILASGEAYSHVCGKACLYRMIDKHIDTKECSTD